MAIVDIKPFLFPAPFSAHAYYQSFTSPLFTEVTLSASTDKFAMIGRAPKGVNLDQANSRFGKVGFRTGAIGQWPTNGLKVSFQDVSATDGNPDGTIDQFCNITSS